MPNQSIVKNPCHRKDGPYSRETYELTEKPVLQYRGVSVYKRFSSWLYVLGDTAITERAGFSKDKAPALIDEILDGRTPSNDAVVAHIRSTGNKGLTYGEYTVEYAAGRMQ